MGRPAEFSDGIVVSVRMESEMYDMIKDIAALESINSGKKITTQELIRQAISFVYADNERLRESFRRSRSHINKKYR